MVAKFRTLSLWGKEIIHFEKSASVLQFALNLARNDSCCLILPYCCSVAQSCPTLCYPKDCNTPRPLCPSPSCPLHCWWHPAVSSSDSLFSFCPQPFPASGTFPMSIQGWFWKVVAEAWKDAGILGFRRRRIQSGARDEAWLLRPFV